MFRINSADYSKMIDEYKSLETVLEEERENLQMLIESSGQTMSGEAVAAWQTGYQKTLDTGAYDEVLRQVRGLCTSMEDMQPLLNRMLEEGELLGEQLESDVLLYPSGSRTYMGREAVLLLEETYASRVDAECEALQDTGEAMRQTMQEVFRLCEGIVDLSDEKEQLNTACKHLKRVRNLQAAFRRYVRGVRDLDESLACLFQAYVEADAACVGTKLEGELLGAANAREIKELEAILQKPPLEWTGEACALAAKSWEKAVEEGDIASMEELLSACMEEGSGRFDYGVLSEMAGNCKGEVAAGILTRLIENKLPVWKYADCMVEIYEEEGILTVHVLQDVLLEEDNTVTVTAEMNGGEVKGKQDIINRYGNYPEEYYEIAAGLLKKDAAGIYKFEELLKMDAGDVSAEERSILGALYRDKCHAIETAPSRESMEKQFDVTEKMVEGLFRYQTCMEDRSCAANTYVDQKWYYTFSKSIADHTSFAYLLLGNLDGYSKIESNGWRDHVIDTPAAGVNIELQKTGLTVQFDFLRMNPYEPPVTDIFYIVSKDRTAAYVNSLPDSFFERLEKLGYTKEEISEYYLLSKSVTDETFIDHILKAEYQEAFLADPDKLSNDICYLLPQYTARIYWMIDADGFCRELEDFVNSMLYQDENVNLGSYHVEDYIDIMYTMSAKWRYARIYESYAGMIEREKAKGAITMDVFWMALHDQITGDGITLSRDPATPAFYNEGSSMLQLKDLIIDRDNCMYFKLMLCDSAAWKEGEEKLYNQRELTIDPVRNPESVCLHKTSNDIKNLQEKLDTLWAETAIDMGVSVLDLCGLKVGKEAKAALALFHDSLGSAVKLGLTSDALKGSPVAKANPYLNPVWSVFDYNDKKDEICKQINEARKDGFVSWFYSADTYYVDYGTDMDGRKREETRYLTEAVSDYDVLQAVRKWDEEGFAGIIQETYPNVSREEIGDALLEKVKEDSPSEEENEVYTFIIYGKSRETQYTSILDIGFEQFSRCMIKLDEYVKGNDFENVVKVKNLDMKGIKSYWDSLLEKGECR